MTLFEIIILSIIYVFCLSFSINMFMETKCGKVEQFLMLLLILIIAPIITTITIGEFIVDIINKSME